MNKRRLTHIRAFLWHVPFASMVAAIGIGSGIVGAAAVSSAGYQPPIVFSMVGGCVMSGLITLLRWPCVSWMCGDHQS